MSIFQKGCRECVEHYPRAFCWCRGRAQGTLARAESLQGGRPARLDAEVCCSGKDGLSGAGAPGPLLVCCDHAMDAHARCLCAEPAGWMGPSRAYHDVGVAAGLDVHGMCVEGAYHSTFLEDALTAGTLLTAAMLQLVTGRSRRATRGALPEQRGPSRVISLGHLHRCLAAPIVRVLWPSHALRRRDLWRKTPG
jgi:hypothetical protein